MRSQVEEYKKYRLPLASRLKHLGDELFSMLNQIYKELGIPFKSRFFPVAYLLHQANHPMGIGEIAKELGLTHSAVSKVCKVLMSDGILEHHVNHEDGRKNEVFFTPYGKGLIYRLAPVWKSVIEIMDEYAEESLHSLELAMESFEEQVRKSSFVDEVLQRYQSKD